MINISAETVRQLRVISGAGVMDCKEALVCSGGNIQEATDYLRKRGISIVEKMAGRLTQEGQIGSYIHTGGKIGVLVDVRCETDFVAQTPAFQELVKEIAMHIAAMDPRFVSSDDITPSILRKEKEILRAQAERSGKPANVVDKIVEGRLKKFHKEACLLQQDYFRNPKITIGDLVEWSIAKLKENIKVVRFTRVKVGE